MLRGKIGEFIRRVALTKHMLGNSDEGSFVCRRRGYTLVEYIIAGFAASLIGIVAIEVHYNHREEAREAQYNNPAVFRHNTALAASVEAAVAAQDGIEGITTPLEVRSFLDSVGINTPYVEGTDMRVMCNPSDGRQGAVRLGSVTYPVEIVRLEVFIKEHGQR